MPLLATAIARHPDVQGTNDKSYPRKVQVLGRMKQHFNRCMVRDIETGITYPLDWFIYKRKS